MKRLAPHVSKSLDVSRRLRESTAGHRSLERALDWLADGVALIRSDGTIVYVNEALRRIVASNDGLRIRKSLLEFATAAIQDKFHLALKSLQRLRDRDPDSALADFSAVRPSGRPPLVVSARPMPAGKHHDSADAIVFIRDPLARIATAIGILREMFGLTDAEASVAQALQNGVSLGDYAKTHAVSINTVYTHLRRIKEKVGCGRMTELIHKLNELRVPVRSW
jgi:DNA-binding CsgD family transcriptional regulator